MKLELKNDGYEQLELKIQSIEDLAWKGIEAHDFKSMIKKFRQIITETKSFRVTLQEVTVINPTEKSAGTAAANAAK